MPECFNAAEVLLSPEEDAVQVGQSFSTESSELLKLTRKGLLANEPPKEHLTSKAGLVLN